MRLIQFNVYFNHHLHVLHEAYSYRSCACTHVRSELVLQSDTRNSNRVVPETSHSKSAGWARVRCE